MRYFIQAFIVIVGFGVAMTSFAAEQMKAPDVHCTQITAAAVPTICE